MFLGRRTAKIVDNTITRFVWNGNVLLHEWQYDLKRRPQLVVATDGTMQYDKAEPTENITTWHYEPNSFTPCAKETDGKFYSIVSDYLGTPTHAFDEEGKKVWERQLDCYGRIRIGNNKFVPFLYPGQYVDEETGLAYNRFRYYDVESGRYLSKDPIGLAGNNPNFYAYISDNNLLIDPLGLDPIGGWNEFLKATRGSFNKASNAMSGAGDGNFMKDAASAWKEYSNSFRTSDLPAIGRLPQTIPLQGQPGYNILKTDRWSLEVNDAWLQGAIDSKKSVHLASDPTYKNLWDTKNNRWSVFKRELSMLENAGYKRKGKMMIHPTYK